MCRPEFAEESEDEAEDIYNSRPLPYVIGTPSYLASETAGLGGPAQDDDSYEEAYEDDYDHVDRDDGLPIYDAADDDEEDPFDGQPSYDDDDEAW